MAAPKVRQIWPNQACCNRVIKALQVDADDAMAGSTSPRPEKEFLACSRRAIGWRLCSGLLLRRHPRIKGIWRLGDHSKAHMGMLYAAEFGACSTVRTRS